MKKIPLKLTGTPQGLLLKPSSESWSEILQQLKHSLVDSGAFFRGGRVILDLEKRSISEEALLSLRTLLDEYDIELWTILSENEEAKQLARAYGLRTRLPGKPSRAEVTGGQATGNALCTTRTLRSGQRLQFPGHITLIGDVNPGAEIIAGGNIIVWGRVRGMVHAGALGDEEAVVCALDLMPSQLRIAGHISRPPDERKHNPQPEIARVNHQTIVAEPWTVRR